MRSPEYNDDKGTWDELDDKFSESVCW